MFNLFKPRLKLLLSNFNHCKCRKGLSNFCALTKPYKILFYGSDNFALASLKSLHENQTLIKQLEVVSKNKSDTPVKKFALENNLKVHLWPPTIQKGDFDIGIVVSFGKLIPEEMIKQFNIGMVNIHASLLPRWRGAAPIIHTILNGDTQTGVTLMEIAPKKFDTGKIYLQRQISIDQATATTQSLLPVLSHLGAELLIEGLSDFPAVLNAAKPQQSDKVTLALKPSKSLCKIEWKTLTRVEIDRRYRALHCMYQLQSNWHGKKVFLMNKISEMEMDSVNIHKLVTSRKPGLCYYHKKRKILCVCCMDGFVAFENVAVQGKKVMTAVEFASGYIQTVKESYRYFD